MKTLVSWYAVNNDFDGNDVRTDGPTYQFHQHFFRHDRHLILSSAQPDEDPKLDRLLNRLLLDFPDRHGHIEGMYMSVKDPIDMSEIKAKVEILLLSLKADEIDLFISPGTPAMQVAWYLCHLTLKLPTHLYQTRAAKFTKNTIPELIPVQAEQSAIPMSVVIKEGLQDSGGRTDKEAYLITPTVQPIYDRADKLAQTDQVTCLIQGASGSGKEHLARHIHEQSSRSAGQFVAVNCSALGDSLLESRLFGHEKGAFTGADKKADGFFDAACGGTLFLDEIGDVSPYMQQTLLRVLQEKEFTPVGSTKARKSDVRIVAATHQSLRDACEAGHFRWDLFYRLSVAELYLPTLAERGLVEKRALIEYFLTKKKKTFRRDQRLKLTTGARDLLDAYLFPGNVRELENLIESLYVFSGNTADVADLPAWIKESTSTGTTFNWKVHEKQLIQRALNYFSGNKSRACEAMGYKSINTLAKRIKEYRI